MKIRVMLEFEDTPGIDLRTIIEVTDCIDAAYKSKVLGDRIAKRLRREKQSRSEISPGVRDQIFDLRSEGLSFRAIKERLGGSPSTMTIRQVLIDQEQRVLENMRRTGIAKNEVFTRAQDGTLIRSTGEPLQAGDLVPGQVISVSLAGYASDYAARRDLGRVLREPVAAPVITDAVADMKWEPDMQELIDCPACEGGGRIRQGDDYNNPEPREDCETCHGKGQIPAP